MSQLHGVDCSKQMDYYDKMKAQLQGSEEVEYQKSEERKKHRREMSSSVPTIGRDGVPKFSGTLTANGNSSTGNTYRMLGNIYHAWISIELKPGSADHFSFKI